MTLPKAVIISKRDTPSIVKFKQRLAKRDNLKLIIKKQSYEKILYPAT